MIKKMLIPLLVLFFAGCAKVSKTPQGEIGKRIIMMRYQVGSASTDQREQGFYDVITRKTDLFFLSSDQYGGATTEESYKKMENLLNKYKTRLDGIFCPNESTCFGALQAIKDKDLAGKVTYVGFDSSPKLIDALRKKYIQGLVLQNPLKMGQVGVETLVKHIKGEQVEKRIDTGVYMATPENMDTPEIKKLLSPPFNEWIAKEGQLPSQGKDLLRIAVIPKGTTHEYWKTIHAGAVKGALKLGNVHLLWKGPLREDDREEQIKVVNNFIAQKVDGIVVAPLDDKALVEPISKAMDSGIPVVIIDSGIQGHNYVSFVATDNYKGGELAAKRLNELLTSKFKSSQNTGKASGGGGGSGSKSDTTGGGSGTK